MSEILVIDDDRDIRALLFETLSGAGHDVRLEANGEAGLASAVGVPPELILLDWMMPERSGLEICHLLRADPQMDDVLVMMLTARGTEADIEWGYSAGADGFVVKPFSPRALVWRVESVLSRGRHPTPTPMTPTPMTPTPTAMANAAIPGPAAS